MRTAFALLGASLLLFPAAPSARDQAQQQPPPPPPQQQVVVPAKPAADKPAADKAAVEKPPFKQEELDQLLASIALYPDDLLSQVLMASTYPIEIVQADRWVKANASLKGDALAKALEKQTWDPSVRSLVNFPQVLTMMSEKLDWTLNIGNAFLGQQKEVMETIQKLRAKAKEAGNLKSSKEQEVKSETQEGKEVIVIEPTDPQVIYVPTYNPTVIYGSWPYPAYPPYYWYPPAYVPPPYPAFHFGVGLAVGVAWGYAWGHCGWGSSDVDVDINRNTTINNNIDRGKHAQQLDKRGANGGKGNFKHDPSHRQGASYRNNATSKMVGGPSVTDNARARDSYRGRTDSAQGKGAADRAAGGAGPANASRGTSPANASKGTSPAKGTGASSRGSASTGRSNAFDGAKSGGASTRAASSRGNSSRSASPSPAARPRGGGGGGRRGR